MTSSPHDSGAAGASHPQQHIDHPDARGLTASLTKIARKSSAPAARGDILYGAWGARRELQSGRKPIMNAIEEMIRERAYELWDHAGRPSGRSDEFWLAARAEFERKKGTAEGQRGAPVRPAKEPISLNSNSTRTKPTPTRPKDAKASPVSSGARPQPTNANANRAEARIARGKTKSATPPIRSPGKAPKQDVGASEPVAPPLEPKSRHGAQTIAAKWTKWKKAEGPPFLSMGPVPTQQASVPSSRKGLPRQSWRSPIAIIWLGVWTLSSVGLEA